MEVNYYLHKRGQFRSASGRMANLLKESSKDQVQISVWDMEMLWPQQSPRNDCAPDPFDDCLYEALEREMRRNTRTGCTVPWTRNNSKICTDQEDMRTAFDIDGERWTRLDKNS